MNKKILITGGAGFIGSHLVRLFVNKYPNYKIYNLDNLTYAGNLENLVDVQNSTNYKFIKGDITDETFINKLLNDMGYSDYLTPKDIFNEETDETLFPSGKVPETLILTSRPFPGKRLYLLPLTLLSPGAEARTLESCIPGIEIVIGF